MNFSVEWLGQLLAPWLAQSGPVALAIGLSGGADSAALLHAAAGLARSDPRLKLRAIHVNHGLSPAAPALAAAAVALAEATGVALRVLAVRVALEAGIGVEAAARDARYAALGAALAPGECLLTGQHREDQAETVLLQLLRGAGLRGLAAMPVDAPLGAGRLLRPLLEVPRASLRAYALGERLAFVEDPMNAEVRYDRAYLRQRVWPALIERWPEAARTLARSAGHLVAAQRLLDERSAGRLRTLGEGTALRIDALLGLSRGERGEVLRHWLATLGLGPLSARRQALIDSELLGARDAGQPCLKWAGGELRRFAGFLYAFAPLAALELTDPSLPSEGARALGTLGRLEVTAVVGAGLRAPAPGARFTLGTRAGGERLRLHAGAPRRALKDLLREARVPPWARERAILVTGEALAAVVLPHATWVAAEYAAGPSDAGLELAWRDAPAALRPAPAPASAIEREAPFR